MSKTIKELADELKVSKQTIQYHYQSLPTKNQQKDSQGTNMISPTAERIIRDKVVKPLVANNQQTGSKESNELIANLRREVADLKSQRDKQLATKDRQIDQLTKLIDQQQQLQLATVSKNKELLSNLLETSKSGQSRQQNDKKDNINKSKTNKSWWLFW